jgi:hypothetical protein
VSWPAKWGQGHNFGIEHRQAVCRGAEKSEHVLAACEVSMAEIRTCTCGGGQGRGWGKPPNPNKLISANVMFIKLLDNDTTHVIFTIKTQSMFKKVTDD